MPVNLSPALGPAGAGQVEAFKLGCFRSLADDNFPQSPKSPDTGHETSLSNGMCRTRES